MKISKKYLVALGSLVSFLAIYIVFACSDSGEWYYGFYHFFNPELSGSKYSNFFRTTQSHFYEHDVWPISHFNSQNVDEWDNFFKNKVKKQDLDSLLYSYRSVKIDSLIFRLRDSNYPLSNKLATNSILSYPNKKLAISFLFYIGYAKRCEPYVTYSVNYAYDIKTHKITLLPDPAEDIDSINKLIDGGKSLLKNCVDSFISTRYKFQITRLLFKSKAYQKCIDFNFGIEHNNYEPSMKYRILGYVAGSYYRLKKYGYANYLYSRIFIEYKQMKEIVLRSFKPMEENDWNECFTYAKNKKEKTILWAMMGINNDALKAMKEIYQFNPKSDYLDLLLTRAVNISEENFLDVPTGTYIYYPSENTSYDFKNSLVDSNLVSFIIKVADAGNVNKPFLWNLSAAYLLGAQKKYNLSSHYYSKAKIFSNSNKYLLAQIHKLQFVTALSQISKLDDKIESQILNDIILFKNQIPRGWPDTTKDIYNSRGVYLWSLNVLSEKYKKQGDFVKSECLVQENSEQFYKNALFKEQMLKLMDREDKTDFEKFLLSIYPIKKENIFDWDAVNLFYQGKYKESLAKFEKCPGSGEKLLPANPFRIRINDCHDCDFVDITQKQFTKISFVKKILTYLDAIDRNSKSTAEIYFALGNAFYNSTYFGNNRALYQTIVKTYDDCLYYDHFNKEDIELPIIDCSLAEKYYNYAFQNSTDPELKTKCLFMAAKCEQNNFFVNKPKDYKGDFRAGKYFHQLKEQYSETQYYQEIIRECGYFRKYISNK